MSGDLVFLIAGGGSPSDPPIRGLCLSTAFTAPVARYGQAWVCEASLLTAPLVVRARPLNKRYANMKDGTPISPAYYIALESTQSPANTGESFYLAAGPGEDAGARNLISSGRMPLPDSANSANLATQGTFLRSAVFTTGTWRPDLKTFLLSSCCGGPSLNSETPRTLRYGESFQLLSAYGYLSSITRPGHSSDTLAIAMTPAALPWRFVPCRTTFSPSGFPGDCITHGPSAFTLSGIVCKDGRCEAGGVPLYFSAAECQAAAENGDEQPNSRKKG